MSVEKSGYQKLLKEREQEELKKKEKKSLLTESQNPEGINTLVDSLKALNSEARQISNHEEAKVSHLESSDRMSTSQKLTLNSESRLLISNQDKQGDRDAVVHKTEEAQFKPQNVFPSEKDEGNLNGFDLEFSCVDDCLVIEALKRNPWCHYEKKIDQKLMKDLFGEEVLKIFRTPRNLKIYFEQNKNAGIEGESALVSMNSEAEVKLKVEENIIPEGKEIFIQLENKIVGLEVSDLYINKISSLSKSTLLPENMNLPRLEEINMQIQKQLEILQGINSSLLKLQ